MLQLQELRLRAATFYLVEELLRGVTTCDESLHPGRAGKLNQVSLSAAISARNNTLISLN
jgi:hypothetical protein